MEEFQSQLDKLSEVLSQHTIQREHEFARSWNKELSAASIAHAGMAANAASERTYEQIQEQLVDICSAYLSMTDEERATARELVGANPELVHQLQNHLLWEVDRVKSPADQDRIMRGLAAISLNDLRTDFRDIMLALGAAYERAHRVGVFFSIPLVKIANLSNRNPRDKNSRSMKDFFLNFETSAFFYESVEPKLNR